MANSAGVCSSFKSEVLMGYHQLGAATITSRTSLTSPTTDTIKAALYLTSASISAATAAYTATGEINAGTVNYTAGGATVTNATAPSTDTTTGIWTPSANIVWNTLTAPTAFNCCLIYNSTQSNRAIEVLTFGDQTVSAANFTLTMPTNAAATALLRLA